MRLVTFFAFFLSVYNLTAQSEVIAKKDALQDFDQLISTFERVHYNPYFLNSKIYIQNVKNNLVESWESDSISYKTFIWGGMQLTALMSGGHSYMDWKNPSIINEIKASKYIPFTGKLSPQKDALIVTKSNHEKIKTGDVVTAINGVNVAELFRECMQFIGGIEAFKERSIERLFPLFVFFTEKINAPLEITIIGKSDNILVDGVNIEELATLLNSQAILKDYSFEIINKEIGLISYNSCNDYKKFRRFLKHSFKTIKKENLSGLIVDVRENGGGNSSLNDLLLAYITTRPYRQSSARYWKVSEEAKIAYSSNEIYTELFGKRFMQQYMNTENQEVIFSGDSIEMTFPKKPKYFFEGRSCFLIGPGTFSSANFLVDAVKTFCISTLIGEPTGEYTNDFGEQLSFRLNHSDCLIYISSTYDIGANGNEEILRPVEPDILVKNNVLEFGINWIMKE